MSVVGANPARIIPAWHEFIDASRAERPARGIGEPIHGGLTAEQLGEAQLHEDLLNVAFAGADAMRLLCPYDTALPPPVLDEARRSHPFLSGSAGQCAAHGPGRVPFHPPPLAAPRGVDLVADYDLAALGSLRAAIDAYARDAGLPGERVDALVLAANELAANSIEHGGGSGHLRAWRDGNAVVCEFHDAGWITDPLVGCARPRADAVDGRGVWLANQVCDLVQVRSDRTTGTTIRLHVGPS
jgi:anti-sigma regulatory factor (Ser/Thr protein kinase)